MWGKLAQLTIKVGSVIELKSCRVKSYQSLL
jgi:replication factor A1